MKVLNRMGYVVFILAILLAPLGMQFPVDGGGDDLSRYFPSSP